jgi:HD-GYP domain-containing protein (c-di-GMP phosphodiesterase class II)
MSSTIAVDDLRVGMYVQLDGGWMRHPFARSSFRISDAGQLVTIRRLGLSQVRWVPEKSDLSHADGVASALVDLQHAHHAHHAQHAHHAEQPDLAGHASATSTRGSRASRASRASRMPMLASHEATQRCEKHFAEALQAWRQASDLVLTQPLQAGTQVTALTRRVLAQMPMDCEIGIRLLSTRAPRAAAHAMNVAVISLLMGRTLGLTDDELVDLGVGAMAHDVGKLVLAERHRHLEDHATIDEAAAYREHIEKGVNLGQAMGLGSTALSVLAQHHERADGSGFPARLTAERQSLAARIVAIVNRYDRLCNPATRSLPLTPHEAVATLFAQGHKRFDATVLNAFIRLMGVYPAGSLVQLTDDRYAMVVGVNSSRPLKPSVLVHNGGPTAQPGAARPQWIDLQQTPNLGIRRSLTASRLPAEALLALDPSPQVVYFFETLSPRRPDARDAHDARDDAHDAHDLNDKRARAA